MPPDALAFYAAVILLMPMACFFLSSPTFLLVGLEIPEVARLLRGIFHGCFLVMVITGTVTVVMFVIAGRPIFAAGAIVAATFAFVARRWFLERMDVQMQAAAEGVAAARRRLRVLHVEGMLVNAIQLAVVGASVPHIG